MPRIHKLAFSERPKERIEFTVQGAGRFPVDMLRYDSCWPQTTEDAYAIAEIMTRDTLTELRRIKLRSNTRPTEGRWQSFGWVVVQG